MKPDFWPGIFVPAVAKNPLHSIATEMIFGGNMDKIRRLEIAVYFIRVPYLHGQCRTCLAYPRWHLYLDPGQS